MNSTSPADNNEFWGKAHARLLETRALLRRVKQVSGARLAAVIAAVALALAAGEAGLLSFWWILIPVAGFGALALVHERLFRRAQAVQNIGELHYRAALRVDRDTTGTKETGTPEAAIRSAGAPAEEPSFDTARRLAARRHRLRELGAARFAEHLDLFGAGELFDRLADWRTDAGGATLADWMLHPAPPDEVRIRQEAVRELVSRPGIREALAATGGLDEWPAAHSSSLQEWLRGPPPEGKEVDPLLGSRWGRGGERLVAGTAAAMSVTMAIQTAALLTGTGESHLFLVTMAVAVMFGLAFRSRVRSHETMGTALGPEISALRQIADTLAGEGLESPRLVELRARLAEASRALARFGRIEARLRARRNLMFAPIAAFLFWGTHHMVAIDRWRRRHGPRMRDWVRAAGEFDALVALAQYTEERPSHIFPEFDDLPGLAAVNLGHPLIPEARLQRNDVHLGRGEAEVWIVTGSNMSGKSTLLRTIGTNFVLARMGAPVAATSFRLGPLSLGASIAVHDSLKDGVSRFLAELLALRAVLDTGSPEEPLLFLLDEVLQGTNSDDRRAATAALLRELGRRSAIGVMTTHDLSLTELAHELPGRVRNKHFTERVVDGAMDFDYQLRDGVLAHGNALDLMRILELPVPGDAEPDEFTSLPPSRSRREH